MSTSQPFYDPTKTYQDNFDHGPFGELADGQTFRHSGDPHYTFLGVPVHTPFGIPAGPLINGRFVKAALSKGFDIPTYKTVRTRAYPCHEWPNVLGVSLTGNLTLERATKPLVIKSDYASPLSITNSFGVPSMDPDWWQPDMADAVKAAAKGQVVVGSFQGTKQENGGAAGLIDDYVLASRLVQETGAQILEANLSCPNEGTADLLCFDTERVKIIAEKIKNQIGNTPLILKLAYFKDQAHLEAYVKMVGPVVDGLSVINTIAAPIINDTGEQALPGKGRLVSGVCGAGISWAGLDMVKRLVTLRERYHLAFSVIGVGGVMEAADFQRYHSAGADAVMSATGAMWNSYLGRDVAKLLKGKY